jgi:ferredoxin-NADP reductase
VLDVPTWPGHRAGHHVDVRLTAEDGYQASRSYSIASAPEDEGLELTIERFEDGEVSPHLVDEVVVGDQLEVRGPVGGPFTWSVEAGGPLYLVGGGSGMVPLMAMLRHRAAHPDAQIAAHVLVSNRSAAAGLYTAELATLTPREQLHVAWTYTRQAPDGWGGWRRRVDEAMLRAAGPPEHAKAATRVFVCGPTPFAGTVTRALVELGYDPRAIRAEEFGATN